MSCGNFWPPKETTPPTQPTLTDAERDVKRFLAMVQEQADEIARLREAIRRIAEQDATLSVCDGNVTVTMDATLTDAEREAIYRASQYLSQNDVFEGMAEDAATLRGLLERMEHRQT